MRATDQSPEAVEERARARAAMWVRKYGGPFAPAPEPCRCLRWALYDHGYCLKCGRREER